MTLRNDSWFERNPKKTLAALIGVILIVVTLVLVEVAERKLKEMDDFLKARGHTHLIYVSPDKQQALGNRPKDATVSRFLVDQGLEVTYLLDRLQSMGLTADQVEPIYYDDVHLSREGHRVWARIIGPDLSAALRN